MDAKQYAHVKRLTAIRIGQSRGKKADITDIEMFVYWLVDMDADKVFLSPSTKVKTLDALYKHLRKSMLDKKGK